MGKEIETLPDFSNKETRAAEERAGQFHYKPNQNDAPGLIERGPYELDNGAVYKG